MGKRGAGEGTIYQRKDGGLWVGQASLPGGKRKAVYGKTRREVADKLATVHQQLRDALPVASAEVTVEVYLRRWIAERCAIRLRPNTLVSYNGFVERHLIPAIGRIRLAALAPADVQRALDRMLAGGLDADTVIRARAVLRKALHDAMRDELVPRNVASLTVAPRSTPHRVDAMSPEEAQAVLAAVRGTAAEGIVTLAMFTGLRRGEALGLQWSLVDLERRILTVRHTLQRIGSEWVLAPPKSRTSERRIPMPPQAVAAIECERARQDAARAAAGDRWTETGLVFTTSTGRPIAGSNAVYYFNAAMRAAGLPSMRFHDLRHAYATLLIGTGVHPRVLMELMGHSTITVTMNIYGHVGSEVATAATDLLAAAMGDAAVTQPGGAGESSAAGPPAQT